MPSCPLKRPQPTHPLTSPHPETIVAAIATPPTPTTALTIAACTLNAASWPSAAGSPRRTPLNPSHTHTATPRALFLSRREVHAKPHLRLAISTLICHALLSCNSCATLQRCLRLRARGGSGRRRRRRRFAALAASQHDDNAVVMSALHTAVLWWVLYSGRLCRAAAAGHDWSFVDNTRGAARSLCLAALARMGRRAGRSLTATTRTLGAPQ